MSFNQKLLHAMSSKNSSLCVGLDPSMERIPSFLHKENKPFFKFNQLLIDATHEHVAAYKPQFAHYGAMGKEDELEDTIRYIQDHYPDILVILDSKRGDIGSTSAFYADEAFERYGADAVTVNPYLGIEGITPFLDLTDKGVFLLCRTSNPGARPIQELCKMDDGTSLFEYIARIAQSELNQNDNVGLVVGATQAQAILSVNQIAVDLPILLPGIGAQGGDPQEVFSVTSKSRRGHLLFNASRSIIYASANKDFDTAAQIEAHNVNTELRRLLNEA